MTCVQIGKLSGVALHPLEDYMAWLFLKSDPDISA